MNQSKLKERRLLQTQLKIIDKKLEKMFEELTDTYPKLELWTTGSIRLNSFEIGTSLRKRGHLPNEVIVHE